MTLLVQYTLIYASVLILVALGGCFAEHSGVINLGLEGIMIMGALGGALTLKYLCAAWQGVPAIVLILSAVLVAALVGLIYSLLLSVACVTFNADQTIVGTALNMLGLAASVIIARAINTAESPDNVSSSITYYDGKGAFVQKIGDFELNWFMVITVILLIVAYILLYKTRFGLRLMACGEHPQAANSVGISVYKMRYAGVMISGVLGGIGGIAYITAGVSEWKFEGGVAGFGFLALAVMIFGNWTPLSTALAAVLFGLFKCIAATYASIDINGDGVAMLAQIGVSPYVYRLLPYLITLVVLAFTSKNSRVPKAEGIPYDKGSR